MQPFSRGHRQLAVHWQHVKVARERANVDRDCLQCTSPAVLRPDVDGFHGNTLVARAAHCTDPNEDDKLTTYLKQDAKDEAGGR